MKVTFTRTGGFAGVTRSVELDDATMKPEEAAELKALVASAKAAQQRGAGVIPGRDRFEYVITIEEESQRHVLRAGETASAPLQRLIEYLSEAAMRRSRDVVRQRVGGTGKRHGSDEKEH